MTTNFLKERGHNKLNGRFTNEVVPPELRFWDKVEKTDTCWIWNGGHASNGYGHFYDGEKDMSAHKYSYQLVYGKVPDGLYLCHKCDNKSCVNPSHLFLGTQKDNIKDAIDKGLIKHTNPQRGSQNGNSKLTELEVIRIKELLRQGMTTVSIGRKFSITHSTISNIKCCKTWKHIS